MTANNVFFNKRFNGYDKDEVDSYIKNLTRAYQTAYDEYNIVCNKYNELLDEYKTLGEQHDENVSTAAVIAKTMVEAEAFAQKIIADARIETDKIKIEAQNSVQKIKEEAHNLLVSAVAIKHETPSSQIPVNTGG